MEKGWQELGQAIRRQRRAAGLSQEGLAGRAGLHSTYLSEIETAKVDPTVNVLRRVADALGVRAPALVPAAEEEAVG